jgi:DNA integrity scanning protein DisA with diadenylate cyclase activity/mannitol/fructose-specific phosphotransferase system IIA component (Ntr-type)
VADKRAIEQWFREDRVIVVHGTDKEALFATLAGAVAKAMPSLNADQIAEALWEREKLLSTRLGRHLAMPHAQFPDVASTAVVVALCPDGIIYDAHSDDPIHLAFCIAGEEANHLETLSSIASTLQEPAVIQGLVEAARAADRERAVALMRAQSATAAAGGAAAAKREGHSQQVWLHAVTLARAVGASCILLHTPPAHSDSYQVPDELDGEVFVLTPDELGIPAGIFPGASAAASGLSLALLFALTERRIRADDVIVNVFGSRDPAYLDTVQVVDVESAFELFFSVSRELALEAAVHRVMLRVVELAAQIGAEGREGKPVGALFVVGDLERVRPHCQQMLMNPFKGYETAQRNILDPGLAETVKELSRIDGAFVIADDGVIESAGTYLRVDVELDQLPAGLGARHAAAASITAVTEAVAVVVSESTRQVSIFRHGRRVVVL